MVAFDVRKLVPHVVDGAVVQDPLEVGPGLVYLIVFAPDETETRRQTRLDTTKKKRNATSTIAKLDTHIQFCIYCTGRTQTSKVAKFQIFQ